MTQALGIDVSKYNAAVDWDVAAANDVIFAGMRASISYLYRDPYITANLAGARAAGVYRMPYHVMYPASDAKAQANNFLAACGDVWDSAVAVIDAELSHEQTRTKITDTLLNIERILWAATGRQPIIYSRASWIDEFTTTGDWRNGRIWWLAHYSYLAVERISPPALPTGVTHWLIHQNSDKIPAWAGLQTGGITTVDRNRWNGDDNAARAWFGGVPEPTLEQRVEALEAWVKAHG